MRAFISQVKHFLSLVSATLASRLAWVAFCVAATATASAAADVGEWVSLAKDGVHDPKSPAVKLLQQPADALSRLTPDHTGNLVRWVQALEKKEIQPREKIFPKTEVRKLDQDILLNLKGSMPAVRFPHRQHTEWLDCVNCHNGIFATKTGETRISMLRILEGDQCGICHGAVAFPLTECTRCHSIPRPGMLTPEVPPGVNPLIHLAPKQEK